MKEAAKIRKQQIREKELKYHCEKIIDYLVDDINLRDRLKEAIAGEIEGDKFYYLRAIGENMKYIEKYRKAAGN